jgi:type III secretion protein D
MKQLRILTGNHAGAQVRLAPGTHRVSADDDADIRILDWTGNAVLLAIDEAGVASARRVTANAMAPADMASESDTPDGEPGVVLMIDYVPMPFDDTVLCVGTEGAAWPSDLSLLSTLLTRTGKSDPEGEDGKPAGLFKRASVRRMLALGACVLLGAIALGGMLTFVMQQARANQPPSDVVIAQRANRAFAEAGLTELHAVPDGHGGTLVTGMVTSQSEDYIVRQMLAKFAPNAATRQYGIAEETARSINEALAINGTEVAYQGNGKFMVTGTVASASAVNEALARVRGDLDKSVKQVEVKVVARADDKPAVPAMPPSGTYSVLVSSGRVQYVETPDGVKHIYTSGDPAASDDDDDADVAMNSHDALAISANNDIANATIDQSKEHSHVRGN